MGDWAWAQAEDAIIGLQGNSEKPVPFAGAWRQEATVNETTVYHGSKQTVEFPEIRVAKFNKDFYFGLYCTVLPEQARRWACRFTGKGIVNEYVFEADEALNVLEFPEMTEEWLDFIAACRNGRPHSYDVVEGPWQTAPYSITCRISLTERSRARRSGSLRGSSGRPIR